MDSRGSGMSELPFCECGCGERVSKVGNRFIWGHHNRGTPMSDEQKIKISKALTGRTISEEHRAATSKGLTGRTLSDDHINALNKAAKRRIGIPRPESVRLAISKALTGVSRPSLSDDHRKLIANGVIEAHGKNPDAWNGANEKMEGGNDIVGHHYIYDHANLELYTMKVTRKKHNQIHGWLRRAGIKIPHINVDNGEWRYV